MHAHTPSRPAALTLGLTMLLLATGCPKPPPVKTPVEASTEGLIDAGDKALAAGNWGDAVSRYSEALALDPDLGQVYENRALAHMRARHFDKSLADFAEALERSPESGRLYYNLGNLYATHSLNEPAIKAFRRALELDPEMFEALNNLGNCLSALKRHDEAAAAFEEVIRQWPDRAEGYNNLGVLADTRRDLDRAEELYRKAIQATPDHPDATMNLASLLGRTQRHLDGIRILEAYLETHKLEEDEEAHMKRLLDRLIKQAEPVQ